MSIVVNTNPSKYRAVTADESQDHIVKAGDYFGTTSAHGGHCWHFDGQKAVRLGIQNPDHQSAVTLADGESLRGALLRVPMFGNVDFVLHKMDLPPGAFYPRMARPSDQHHLEAPGMLPEYWLLADAMVSTLNQVRSLVEMLDTVFQSVHPADANLSCYGNSIRNLLILACTECEAQWRGVLAANGTIPSRPSTTDYVKLATAMRLGEYAVRFQHFPWLEPMAPYRQWSPDRPTQSIAWYDAYNAAKHDRETAFSRATLASSIQAVAAVWIMVAAQFGIHGVRHFYDLDRYFHLERVPLWRYSEVYTYGYEGFNKDAGKRRFFT